MKFTKLSINNFRGIQKLEIDDFKRVNLFLGKNNSGKTSLLEAIFLSVGISNPQLPVRIDEFRNLRYTEENDFRSAFYNLDYNNELKIVSNFENEHQRTLNIKPSFTAIVDNDITTDLESEINKSVNFDTQIQQKINGLNLNFSIKEKNGRAKKHSAKISIKREGNKKDIHIEQAKDYSEPLSGVFITSDIEDQGISNKLDKLIIQKRHKSLVNALSTIDPNIIDVTVVSNGMIYFDIGIDRLIPANLIGDGVRRLLTILTSMAVTREGVILIDEIENGLHFSALKTLWRSVLTAAKEFDVQIFATTHNQETLKYLKEVLEEETYTPFQDEIRSYTLRKLDKETKAYKYKFDEFEHSVDYEIEIR